MRFNKFLIHYKADSGDGGGGATIAEDDDFAKFLSNPDFITADTGDEGGESSDKTGDSGSGAEGGAGDELEDDDDTEDEEDSDDDDSQDDPAVDDKTKPEAQTDIEVPELLDVDKLDFKAEEDRIKEAVITPFVENYGRAIQALEQAETAHKEASTNLDGIYTAIEAREKQAAADGDIFTRTAAEDRAVNNAERALTKADTRLENAKIGKVQIDQQYLPLVHDAVQDFHIKYNQTKYFKANDSLKGYEREFALAQKDGAVHSDPKVMLRTLKGYRDELGEPPVKKVAAKAIDPKVVAEQVARQELDRKNSARINQGRGSNGSAGKAAQAGKVLPLPADASQRAIVLRMRALDNGSD